MSAVAFLVGRTVVEVQDGNRLVFEPGSRTKPSLYADLGACTCVGADGGLEPLAELVGSTVVSSSADAGVLALSFSCGASLRCEPQQDFEAWQVVGGGPQHLVVCLPGGELAVWDRRHVPTPAAAERIVADLSALTGWDVQVHGIDARRGTIRADVQGTADETAG